MAKNVFISTSSCSPRRLAFATEALAPVRGLRASPGSAAGFDVRGREEAGRVQTTQASRGDPHLLTSQPSLSPHVSCESYVCCVYVCYVSMYVCYVMHVMSSFFGIPASTTERVSVGDRPRTSCLPLPFLLTIRRPWAGVANCVRTVSPGPHRDRPNLAAAPGRLVHHGEGAVQLKEAGGGVVRDVVQRDPPCAVARGEGQPHGMA